MNVKQPQKRFDSVAKQFSKLFRRKMKNAQGCASTLIKEEILRSFEICLVRRGVDKNNI